MVSNSHKKMKILLIYRQLGKGGVERVLLNIVENLDKTKIELILVFHDFESCL